MKKFNVLLLCLWLCVPLAILIGGIYIWQSQQRPTDNDWYKNDTLVSEKPSLPEGFVLDKETSLGKNDPQPKPDIIDTISEEKLSLDKNKPSSKPQIGPIIYDKESWPPGAIGYVYNKDIGYSWVYGDPNRPKRIELTTEPDQKQLEQTQQDTVSQSTQGLVINFPQLSSYQLLLNGKWDEMTVEQKLDIHLEDQEKIAKYILYLDMLRDPIKVYVYYSQCKHAIEYWYNATKNQLQQIDKTDTLNYREKEAARRNALYQAEILAPMSIPKIYMYKFDEFEQRLSVIEKKLKELQE